MLTRFFTRGIIGLSLLLTACSGGKEYDLKYRPTANTRFAFSNVTTMHMDQKMMGQNMKMDQEMIYDGVYEIGAMGSDSSYDVTLTYTRIRVNQTMESPVKKETKMDSDKIDTTSSSEDQKMYTEILNVPMKMKISKTGKVMELKGLSEAINAAVADKMGTVSKEAEEMAGQFSDDNLKNSMEFMFALYPEKKVSPKDSWELEQKYEAGYPMLIKQKYVFEEEKEGKIILSNTGTIQTNKGGKGMMAMMAKMIELKGDQTGTIELDQKTGLPLMNSSEMKITGEMNMMGVKFPIQMNTTSKVSLKALN